jgi:hypothetical protein
VENAKGIDAIRQDVAKVQGMVQDLQQQIANQPIPAPPPDLSRYATRDDLAATEGRLVTLIESLRTEIPPPQTTPNAIRHMVLIAEEGAAYWPRLLSEINRARDHFFDIRVAPPSPTGHTGLMPKLVEYVNGTPIQMYEGLHKVSSVLDDIARGNRATLSDAR